MHIRCLFIAIVFLSLPVRTYSEGSHPPFPETQEEDQPSELLVEKVYLHLDRSNYLSGEMIWYKAYLVDAMRNTLSDHSKTLYVELVSPGMEILDRKMIRMETGTGVGDFSLDNSLATGTYLVRAYTNWIRNFGSDLVFHREIRILNSEYPELPFVNQQKEEQDEIDVQFFPEGGSLVAGVPTSVGFKAVDQNGHGCRVEGYIATREGDTLLRIKSTHLGLGSFKITPANGARYQAIISNVYGSALRFDLPKVFEEGYVLNVKEGKKDELDVIIKTNRQTFSSQDTLPVYLQVKTGEGNFLVRMDVTYLAQSLTLQKNSFPPGIAHLILYDAEFNPHCERLVYLDPPLVHVKVDLHKSDYSPHEKAVLNVRVTDENDSPIQANMSLAAVDASALAGTTADPTHIRSYLLLESELRGVVENPGYYFNEEHTDRQRKMDLLMLTQGWRDFIWKYPSDTTIQINYPAEKGLTITGRLLTALGKRPMIEASISLAILGDSNSYVDLTNTDSLGKYRFSNLDFIGSENITVSAMDKKGRARGIIQLDSILRPDFEVEYSWAPTGVQRQFILSEYIEDASVKRDIMKQYSLSDTIPIEEVMITARWRAPKDEHHRIYRKPDNVIEVRDHERHYKDIFELIQGKVPGVVISGGYPYYGIYIRGISNLRGDTQPLFLLDGIPVEMEIIMNIPVQSVDKIEVLKNIANTAMFGSRGANGVISVFTNTELHQSIDQPVLYTLNTEIKGYDEERIFYAPRYDKPRPDNQAPDLRTTIHWEPFVQTADHRSNEITFFNADIPATILIMVEGITGDGIPVYSRTSYQVK